MVPGYKISANKGDMNIDVIHSYISRSYWASGIPIETMKKAIENSECFGVFTDEGIQVGFARMISDLATFAYLSDVFILEEHRNKGLSKWLMEVIHQSENLQGLRRMVLATRDAHELYEQSGYTPLNDPQFFMEKWNPNIYRELN